MKKLIMAACLLLAGVLVLTGVASVSAAGAGSLDTTFNSGGAGADALVSSVVVQPDGKIVIGGDFTSYNGDAAAPDHVMRLNANGTRDTAFNSGGAGANNSVNALAVQPDGKILIAGTFNAYNGNAAAPDNILRLNADGSLDSAFNAGGAGANNSVNALAVQQDGKIVIGGTFTAYNGDTAAPDNILRLNADGTRDTGFNPSSARANGPVYSLALQSDGKVLVGGETFGFTGSMGAPDNILRLNADGTRDTGFNPSGGGPDGPVVGIVAQPDGKIVICGEFFSYNGDAAAPNRVLRLNADGSLDTTFDPGGGVDGTVSAVAVQSDGRVVVVGRFGSLSGNTTAPNHVMRLNANGSLDTTFNPGGDGADDAASAVALQPDGKILVGGSFTAYNGDPAAPNRILRLHGQASKLNQTITVNTHAPAAAAHGTSFTVAASSDSGLPVTYSSAGACTNVGATFTMTSGTGTCTVKYDQAGDSDHNPASQVSETVTAQKADQTITFGAPADKTFGDADFTVSATASSGLPVSFAASGKCSVSGATVHLTGAGSCTVTASQGGDATNYNAAPDVQRSFQIAKAATTTALSSSANPSSAGQGVTFTATVASAAGTPTGAVTFKDGGVAIAGCESRALAFGQATCTTTSLSVGNHSVTADYAGDANFNASAGSLSATQVVGNIEFSQSLYTVAERGGEITITVRRLGDTSQASSVDYSTDDGSVPSVAVPCSSTTGLALERCDYTRAAGTLRFAAGDAQKTFTVLVSDDSYTEGTETARLLLSNPTGGAVLGATAVATLEITDDATESAGNPIDDAQFFVRQHYHDFLNREPDADGLAFWTNQMTQCGSPNLEVCRINVSAAFFLSIEFKETGYFVERLYKVAYGDVTGASTLGGAHQLSVPAVRLNEFLRDTQQIGQGVVVGVGEWQERLEANKQAFTLEFVRRQRFRDAFPAAMTAEQFVTKLDQNAGGMLTADERAQLRAVLSPDPSDDAKRAQALRQVAENATLRQREINRAFVLMQYFGYLRRDPDAAPDKDHTGYEFWLRKLDQFGGNFVQAEMVRAFITSDEYRERFGR